MEEIIYTNEYENKEETSVSVCDEQPKESGKGWIIAGIVAVCAGLGLAGKAIHDKVTGKSDLRKIQKLQKKGYIVMKAEESDVEVEIEE